MKTAFVELLWRLPLTISLCTLCTLYIIYIYKHIYILHIYASLAITHREHLCWYVFAQKHYFLKRVYYTRSLNLMSDVLFGYGYSCCEAVAELYTRTHLHTHICNSTESENCLCIHVIACTHIQRCPFNYIH